MSQLKGNSTNFTHYSVLVVLGSTTTYVTKRGIKLFGAPEEAKLPPMTNAAAYCIVGNVGSRFYKPKQNAWNKKGVISSCAVLI